MRGPAPTAMTTTKPLTADDLLRLASEGVRGELIRGELHETMSVGGRHGEIAAMLISELVAHVRPRRLGRVAGTDAGILLERDPDTVREPDIAFISAERLPLDVTVSVYYDVVPDLVVEIISPNDGQRAAHDRARMWLSYGVGVVWLIDPEARTVAVHRPGSPGVTLSESDTLEGGPALPGFTCSVRNIFSL